MTEQAELEALDLAIQKAVGNPAYKMPRKNLDPEVEQLRQLWEGSQGWRAPLGDEPDLEELEAREDLDISPREGRTLISCKRPLDEGNPKLPQTTDCNP